MSVLIKGMEMPETCSDCEWSYYVGNGRAMCRRVSKTDKTDIMTKRRADFCPLIEVHTPHGRLADLDQIIDEYWDGYYMRIGASDLETISSKTIIEAEE